MSVVIKRTETDFVVGGFWIGSGFLLLVFLCPATNGGVGARRRRFFLLLQQLLDALVEDPFVEHVKLAQFSDEFDVAQHL